AQGDHRDAGPAAADLPRDGPQRPLRPRAAELHLGEDRQGRRAALRRDPPRRRGGLTRRSGSMEEIHRRPETAEGRFGPSAFSGIRIPCYTVSMTAVSLNDFQRDLLGYLRRVAEGETYLIVQDNRPLAELRPAASPPPQPRPFGLCSGKFAVPDEFDRPCPT